MLEQIKKLIGHSVLYGLGLVGSSVAAVFLTPMFLHRLSRSEYGMLDLLHVFSYMLQAILILGIGSVLIKVYVNDYKTEDGRRSLMSSIILFMTAASMLVLLLSYLFSSQLSRLLFDEPGHDVLVLLSAVAGGLLLIQSIGMLGLRAKQLPGTFTAVSLFQVLLLVILSIYLVAFRHQGVLGAQIATVIANSVSLVVCLVAVRSDLGFRFDVHAIKYVLALSIPLIPMSIGPFILNMSNRYFITHYAGLSANGLYAAGHKIGQLPMILFVNSVCSAWSPLFYANSDNEDAPRLCASVMKYYIIVMTLAALLLSIFAPEVLRVISSKEYWGSSWIVPYVALAYMFFGIQLYLSPLIIKRNRGRWLGVIVGCAAAFNLLLNWILIPRFGISGAVAATLASFSVQSVAVFLAANKVYPVPYQYANVAKIVGVGALLYFVFRNVQAVSVWTFLLKAALVPIFALLVFAMRSLTSRELEVLQGFPSKAMGKLRLASHKIRG